MPDLDFIEWLDGPEPSRRMFWIAMVAAAICIGVIVGVAFNL